MDKRKRMKFHYNFHKLKLIVIETIRCKVKGEEDSSFWLPTIGGWLSLYNKCWWFSFMVFITSYILSRVVVTFSCNYFHCL
jgi:hypothetical protein